MDALDWVKGQQLEPWKTSGLEEWQIGKATSKKGMGSKVPLGVPRSFNAVVGPEASLADANRWKALTSSRSESARLPGAPVV